jgi:putative transposase
MKRSKFTEEQIIAILRDQEAGAKTAEVCRGHGISGATVWPWKAKFGGMEPSEAKRLKALDDENAKLKGLFAEAMLDSTALKDLLSTSGNARRQAQGRCLSRTGLRGERAAGVFHDRGGSVVGAVSAPAPG